MIEDCNERIGNAENSITLLKALGGGNGADGGDGNNLQGLLDALEKMIGNLRRELNTNLASKSDLDSLRRKVEDIIDHQKDQDKKLENHDTSIS